MSVPFKCAEGHKDNADDNVPVHHWVPQCTFVRSEEAKQLLKWQQDLMLIAAMLFGAGYSLANDLHVGPAYVESEPVVVPGGKRKVSEINGVLHEGPGKRSTTPSLRDLILAGYVVPGQKAFRVKYGGREFFADVDKNGKIVEHGTTTSYRSLSLFSLTMKRRVHPCIAKESRPFFTVHYFNDGCWTRLENIQKRYSENRSGGGSGGGGSGGGGGGSGGGGGGGGGGGDDVIDLSSEESV